MQLCPFTGADWPVFLLMSQQMYDSPAVAHPVEEATFRATFDACLSGGKNVEGFMLQEQGAAVGYVLLASSFSTEVGAPILMVEELFFLPQYRGHGLGRQVLELLSRRFADRIGALKLECTPENAGAMHLYRSLGFEPLPYTAMVLPVSPVQS